MDAKLEMPKGSGHKENRRKEDGCRLRRIGIFRKSSDRGKKGK